MTPLEYAIAIYARFCLRAFVLYATVALLSVSAVGAALILAILEIRL